MTKKERVIAAIEKKNVDCIPSGFSLHFPHDCNSGAKGIDAHIRFFQESDADICKIMNENLVPSPGVNSIFPEAYKEVSKMDLMKEIIEPQIAFAKEIAEKCDKDSFLMGTLHGICASGLHPIEKSGYDYDTARKIQRDSLVKDEKTTLEAFNHITDAMIELVKGYKAAGLDAVYFASLGAEKSCFSTEEFDKWIKPFELKILKAIKDEGLYAFLHICKDGLDMTRYADYVPYSDVVNWGVYEVPFSLEEGRKLFAGCTIMGGLKNRSGVLVDGNESQVKGEVHKVISEFGRTGFILGADCTLATEQDMGLLKAAVAACRD